MSRFMRRLDTYIPNPENLSPAVNVVAVAYGYDHVCGFFFQALDANEDAVIDLDSLFTGLTGPDLAQKLEDFDVPIPEIHRASMCMDMPF
jgi:hypothetical protein